MWSEPTSTTSEDLQRRSAWRRAHREAALVGAAVALAVGTGLLGHRLAGAVGLRSVEGFAPGLVCAALLLLLLYLNLWRMRYRGLLAQARAEAAVSELTRKQLRVDAIVSATQLGIWEVYLDVDQILVDEQWAAMIGHHPDELGPLNHAGFYALIHAEDRAGFRSTMQKCFDTNDLVFEYDFRMRHRNGAWVWIATRGIVVERDANQRPLRMVGTHANIVARKKVEAALKVSEGKFRSLFELSPVGISLTDYRTGRYLDVNDALLAPTGYTREEFLLRSFRDMTPPEYTEQDALTREALHTVGRYGPFEREHIRKDGSCLPILVSGLLTEDGTGHPVVWSIVQDISHRKAVELALSAAARADRLTGLANRTLFMEQLQRAIERVQGGEQAHLAVLFLDFDHFKRINDAMGHEAGDELLRQISLRLSQSLRGRPRDERGIEPNLVARFGGDEFLVLVNDLTVAADVHRVAEQLMAALAVSYHIHGRDVTSTASIGIMAGVLPGDTAETLVRNADVAMYEAKRAGRGRSILFDDAMHARLARQVQIELDLRSAVATPQLYLVYQPIRDLDTGDIVSAEALLRWDHPQLGAISPAEFIPIAEESGLIVTIGAWVMQEACRTMAQWQRESPEYAPRTMSVNVSRAELALGPQLLGNVLGYLASAGLPAQCLQLEVTEREVMRDPGASLQLMHALRSAGVRLAMDDFGTGTSSLSCLREYPFDAIKIDRSFVHDLAANRDGLAVIHATITLAKNLGKTSIAEGIESAEQAAILQSFGCSCGQGYHLGRPMPARSLLERCQPALESETATGT